MPLNNKFGLAFEHTNTQRDREKSKKQKWIDGHIKIWRQNDKDERETLFIDVFSYCAHAQIDFESKARNCHGSLCLIAQNSRGERLHSPELIDASHCKPNHDSIMKNPRQWLQFLSIHLKMSLYFKKYQQ